MRRFLQAAVPYIAYAAVALFVFWAPLVQSWGSIQWDSVGVHFLNISFSSELLHQGVLPLWTPYLFGGFPQIADMQVALWYPPILILAALTKFSAAGLLWEIAFHYILAASFMYLLARELRAPRTAAWGLGLAYALGGFMAGHASHVGMMNAAAWLPLIVLLLMRALGQRSLRYAVGCGAALGISMLAGHFQISLYTILFVIMYGTWVAARPLLRQQWREGFAAVRLVAIVGLFAVGIAAVQYIPTFQLVAQSERSAIPLSVAQSESLKPSALTGFVSWNYRGVATEPYTGPWDRTQNYLFIGLSTLALAAGAVALGLRNKALRPLTGFFIIITAFSVAYALGPATPLHALLYHIPLLGTVRAPGNMLLLAHLSLICLAAMSWRSFPLKFLRWSSLVFVLIIGLELIPKATQNKLLWGRQSPAQIFANAPIAQRVLEENRELSPERRFRVWRVPGLDNNEPQYWHIDDFGGYNPLELARHSRYVDAMMAHPKLMALAGIRYGPCNLLGGTQLPAPWAPGTCRTTNELPRIFLVGRLQTAQNAEESLRLLTQTEPFSTAIVERDSATDTPGALGSNGPFGYDVRITAESPGFLQLRVKSAGDAMAVITQTYWPGWEATIEGVPAHIWRTDYLFQGIRVPAGEHVIELTFRPRIFAVGAAVSVATLICAIGVLFILRRSAGPTDK